MRILHPSGGRLSMRFNDLRLHNTDTVQVGETSLATFSSPRGSLEISGSRNIYPCHLSFPTVLCQTEGDILSSH